MPVAIWRQFFLLSVCLIVVNSVAAQDEGPKSLDPRLTIELFAAAPQIVTPTGIDVDHAGRVWAIESNTHFRPEGYTGHSSDRILVMQDTDHDGKADKVTAFKDELTHTMSVAVKPAWLDMARRDTDLNSMSGVKLPANEEAVVATALEVYIATRQAIYLCRDTDGDLKCDETRELVHLDTKGNYPHNGLAGFAFDALGNIYFGFGENLGADYKIIGSDQVTLAGGGEGGNLYRCRPDGTSLQFWATGFWNPHASCIDGLGRMFTLDNDPDSRPPCRLLHIVQNGDYGYRFRNGRKGTHPFTSWNGEQAGTLPMVSGTGEAPSGIVSYESDGFPDDYFGTLLVGSWGDHRIDKFVLKPRGLSFESMPQPIITGGENFRPVGLALAPDGSLFVTDWVLKDYNLHGQGRVWRVSNKSKPKKSVGASGEEWKTQSGQELVKSLDSPTLTTRRLAAKLLAGSNFGRLLLDGARRQSGRNSRRDFELARAGVAYAEPEFVLDLAKQDLRDPFLMARLVNDIADKSDRLAKVLATPYRSEVSLKQIVVAVENLDRSILQQTDLDWERCEVAMFLAMRRTSFNDSSFVRYGLRSDSPSIRRLAVQWIGERPFKELRPEVERIMASQPMTADLFMACLASLSMLDGTPPAEFEKTPPVKYLLPLVTNASKPPALRVMALRILPATQPELDAKLLGEMLTSPETLLRREAVRTLQHSPIAERDALLRTIAADESQDVNLRADAVAGLACLDHSAALPVETRGLLIKLAAGHQAEELQLEAIRSLRGAVAAKSGASRDVVVEESLKRLIDDKSQSDRHPAATEAARLALGLQPPQEASTALKPLLDKSTGNGDQKEQQNQVEAGRRAFFHSNGAGCYKCHMISGRGGQVGPDLTVIARTMDRKNLAESILEPSKEIAPQFTTWAIETKSGKTVTGMLVGEEVNGDLRLANQLGAILLVPFKDIETRTAQKTSVMPEKLQDVMTPGELNSVIRYLESLK